MKKSPNFFFLIILITFSLCGANCKKEKEDHQFDAIQSLIQGKWKLEYGKGGICGSCVQYFSNSYYTFLSKRILIVTNGIIYTDTTITWTRNLGVNTGLDSAFIMSFYDNRGYPLSYVVDGIINDSLVFHDNAVDGQYYHFSKSP